MGFFHSLKDLTLGSNSDAEDMAKSAGINLGNIFLPGGMQGGTTNTFQGGGYGGTPLNEADATELSRVYGAVSDANNFDDINWNAGNFRGVNFAGNNLSPEATEFLRNNWGAIRGANKLGDVSWQGVVGAPKYAAPTNPNGSPATPASPLGDLEPSRGMFANIAATGNVGENQQGNILELLRAQARPGENQAFNRINQNLFSRGRLGANDSTTGEAYAGFSRGISEADTSRQLASYGLSEQLQTGQLDRMLGGAQGAAGLTNLSTLPFDMALKLAIARSNASLGQASVINQSGGMSLLEGASTLFGGGGMFGPGGRWGPVK